jgi:putative acetyltransferase
MSDAIVLRPEQPADHAAVHDVVARAFGQPDEARLVDALRLSLAFIPELSLVAIENAAVVGHVLFTRVTVRDRATEHAALALAPVAVRPDRQRTGVGTALIRRGLDDARRLGHGVVLVVGHPPYYPRFGFVPAEPLGLRVGFPISPGAFMALALRPGALDGLRGEVQYPPEFGV